MTPPGPAKGVALVNESVTPASRGTGSYAARWPQKDEQALPRVVAGLLIPPGDVVQYYEERMRVASRARTGTASAAP
jgi:hypothetical protein